MKSNPTRVIKIVETEIGWVMDGAFAFDMATEAQTFAKLDAERRRRAGEVETTAIDWRPSSRIGFHSVHALSSRR